MKNDRVADHLPIALIGLCTALLFWIAVVPPSTNVHSQKISEGLSREVQQMLNNDDLLQPLGWNK